jgi:hypothetical protein
LRSLCRTQPLHRGFPEHVADRPSERFGAVDHEQDALLGIEAALDQVGQQRGRDGGVLGRAFPEPERDLDPLGRDPERDHVHAFLEIEPVDHHHRQAHVVQAAAHQLRQRHPRPLDEGARDRRLRRRPRLLLHLLPDRLLRPAVAASGDASEHPLQHRLRQRVTVAEVLIRRKPHLLATVGAPYPRPLHRDPPAAERHLTRLVPVPHRDAIRDVLALGTDQLDDLLLEQLSQHTEADTDAQRQQALLRRPDQLAERLLHARRQHHFVHARLPER